MWLRKHDESAMTLIEIMIVVLIIGLLVAVAVLLYTNATAGAKDKSCQANIKVISTAVEQYREKFNEYPPNGHAGVEALKAAGFLKSVPNDPHSGAGPYTINGSTGAVDTHPACGMLDTVHEYMKAM
jgi:type IV pilus assembly protein PilA